MKRRTMKKEDEEEMKNISKTERERGERCQLRERFHMTPETQAKEERAKERERERRQTTPAAFFSIHSVCLPLLLSSALSLFLHSFWNLCAHCIFPRFPFLNSLGNTTFPESVVSGRFVNLHVRRTTTTTTAEDSRNAKKQQENQREEWKKNTLLLRRGMGRIPRLLIWWKVVLFACFFGVVWL